LTATTNLAIVYIKSDFLGPRHLRKPEVSIDPSAVNSHLLSASLKNGLVINGTVMSIEEKGQSP
jgi:hypothetical protein